MQHDDVRHKLSDFIDGSVTPVEKAGIEAHLKTCLQCSDALSELKKTIEHIKTIEEIEPPDWMTRKIMATVRAEAKGQKEFFHRIFFPLHVKLPVQVIAVLFLAITAYTINQNIQRTPELSETPLQGSAVTSKSPPIGTNQDRTDKTDKTDVPTPRSKQFPQAPEYKTLDMKREYEKPEPPAPAKPLEQPSPASRDAEREKPFAAPQAGAPAEMPDQLASSQGAVQQNSEKKYAPPQGRLKAAMGDEGAGPTIAYTASVKNVETAARDMESTIGQLGGTFTKAGQLDIRRIYTITMSEKRVQGLLHKLKALGVVTERATIREVREDRVTFKIEIVKQSTPP